MFIGALSSLYGHAWVIDGFVTRIATHNVTGDAIHQMLLHCNWGVGVVIVMDTTFLIY